MKSTIDIATTAAKYKQHITAARRRGRETRAAVAECLESRQMLTTVVVNEPTDILYAQGSGLISLRNAVATADASTTPTTISFDPTVFSSLTTITLNQSNGTAGRLDLNATQSTTIVSPAAGLSIVQPGTFNQVLECSGGNWNLSNMTMTGNVFIYGGNLTLTDVSVVNPGQDGVVNNADGNMTLNDVTINGGSGTAITSDAAATLNNVSVQNNVGSGAGAIEIQGGTTTMTNVTIAGNSGTAGGGIANYGTLHLTDVTIANNTTSAGSGQNITGGAGIYNAENATLTADDCTIANNQQTGAVGSGYGGGGIYNAAAASDVVLANTIIAGNTAANLGPDVYGGITSLGHNLIGETDNSSGWISSDLTGTITSPLSANLGTLANNGGATETLLPARNSPAVDAGSNTLIPSGITTDQRGEPRIYNSTVDIGSVELQAAPVVNITITPPANQTATTGESQSFTLGSFAEVNATGPYTVTANWGDGSAATNFQETAAGTIASQLHTYTTASVKTISVSILDSLGDASNTSTFTTTVAQAISPATTTTVVASASSADVGSSVTFTAQVNPVTTGAPVPSGSVSFLVNGVFVGSATINGSGQANFTTGALSVGANLITAQFNGSSTYDGSTSSAATVNVSALPLPTVSLAVSSSTIAAGDSVTLTALVSPADGDGTPTGSVTFLQGGTSVGTATVQSNGKASLTVSSTIPGTFSYSASYGGSTTYSTNSSALVPVTYTSGTTVSLAGPSGLAYLGEPVALTVTVTADVPGGAAPAGSVTLFLGATNLGTGVVTNGQAVLTLSTLPVGNNAITAMFPAEVPYTGSTSAAMTQTVLSAPNSQINVNSSAGAVTEQGQPVTLTVPVVAVAAGAAAPTGTVTFTLNGTVLQSVPVQSDGTAVFTSSALPTGSNAIVVSYSGDTNYTNSAPVTTVVNIDAPGPVISSILSSTVPTSIVSGTRLTGVIRVQIGNPTLTLVSGPTRIFLYGLSADGTANVTQSLTVNLHIEPGKTQIVSVPVNTILTLSNASYTLQLGVNTVSGQINLLATGPALEVAAPFTSLVSSSLLTTGLTGTVVSGTTTRGSVKIVVKNQGNVKWSGPVVFSISASGTANVVGTHIVSITRTLVILPGKTKTIVLPLGTLPALPTGSFYIVMQISTASGASTVSSAAPVAFAAPFISLSVTFAISAIHVLTNGGLITITNTGNIDDLSTFTAVLGFSSDPAGVNAVGASATHTVGKVRVKAGKSVKIYFNEWKSLASSVNSDETLYATIVVTDETNHSASAVIIQS